MIKSKENDDNYLYLKLNRLRIPGFKLDVWLIFWRRNDIYQLVRSATDLKTVCERAATFIKIHHITDGIRYKGMKICTECTAEEIVKYLLERGVEPLEIKND